MTSSAASGGTECAGRHYAGSNGGCVITAAGFAVTKEPTTDLFARRFHDAGFSVLAFDYRGIGESGGQPRQVQHIRDQLADWQVSLAGRALSRRVHCGPASAPGNSNAVLPRTQAEF